MDLDEYVERFARLGSRWNALLAFDPEGAAGLVADALRDGLQATPSAPEGQPLSDDAMVRWSAAVIEASGEFDAIGYRAANREVPRVRSGRLSPLEHFTQNGWWRLRNPRADFDMWWYWSEHLDPSREDINPFVHHLLVGRREGLSTTAPHHPVRPAPPVAGPGTRRICLFAGYDRDGLVDDYVVDYLRELGRFADVYYLADGTMSEDQLARLADVTRGAWAIPHERYEFGSYSILAAELVGWDVVDQYDELLLANDKHFLLRPLDHVFDRMRDRAADWCGLHAAKRDFAYERGNQQPIPLAEARELHTERDRWNADYRLHLGSHFLLLRKRVMDDPGFRRRLDTVVAQPSRTLGTRKYEIGISDYLIRAGFSFDTYVPALYPYAADSTADYFEILADGYPLLQRRLITTNPRRTPDIDRWRERVLAVVPDAPVEMFQRNIERVAADNKLVSSLSVRTGPDGEVIDPYAHLSPKQFRELDRTTPVFEHWWAFPVCAYDHTLAGNERAVFEEVRTDPSLKKIILTRSRAIEVEGENVVVVPIDSPQGQYYLARAGQIFVKHGPIVNVPWPVDPTAHNFINLWHGIPLKRFGLASLGLSDRNRDFALTNHGKSRAVIASSTTDSLAMSAAFFPASYPDIWPTGLPRNDYVRREDDLLPADLRASADRLREEVGERHLVLFLPTFKDGQADSYYEFSDAEVAELAAWGRRHNAVIGVRQHMADKAKTYGKRLEPVGTIDLSSSRYPDLEVLYRVADALISDYSSCLVDFMLTGKPVISFAYDYERYATEERGLFYELDRVLPGPVCRTFDELARALEDVFRPRTPEELEEYSWRRRIFFDNVDDQASWRVVQRVKGLYGGHA